MKKNLNLAYVRTTLCAFAVILGGCFGSSKSATFYTLSPLEGAGTEQARESGEGGLTIGLGPILFPKYLDRPQIVTRAGPNQVEINDFHRWAAPLEDHVRNILRENLIIRLPMDRVVLFPWKGDTPIDYQVEIHINRFDGRPGESMTLLVRWRVSDPEGKKVFLKRTSTIHAPLNATDYDSLVAAKSQVLADLTHEIADAILGLPPLPAAAREGEAQAP
jgi:uncharacterized lipoprotein YmbA